MSLNKPTRIILVFSLLFLIAGGSISVVNAERAESKRHKCKDRDRDRDRNADAYDEERTRGDCSGTVPTPEPVSILLFSAGLAGVGFAARRRLRKSESES